MQNRTPFVFTLTAFALSFSATQTAMAKDNIVRAGIIGCDTSHVEAFTKIERQIEQFGKRYEEQRG